MKFMNQFKEGTSLVLLALLLAVLVLVIIFAPFAIIWSLNTLFVALAIPYTFWSWLAVVVLNFTWASKLVLAK